MKLCFFQKRDFYSAHLESYIENLQKGDLGYIPQIFCVFAENSVSHKLRAAKALNKILKSFSCDDICRVDLRMRETTSIERYIDWRSLSIKKFIMKQMSEDEQRAVLVFASFNPNGYIREHAVELLVSYEKTLPFILLRLNDWVYPVRQAALTGLSKKIEGSSDEDVIEALPFIEKLRKSKRCQYDTINSMIMEKLNSQNTIIKNGLMSEDIRTRRFCVSVLPHLEKVDNTMLLTHLKSEKDPFLRRMVFQSLLNSNIDIEKLSEKMLTDKYPPNRILALQSLNNEKSPLAFDAAGTMLLDKNTQVRTLARNIILEKDSGIDFHLFYIDNLEAKTPVSLYGLGETGISKDCRLIVHFLTDNRISVIRAAMTALMRLDPETFLPRIITMLSSEHDGIVKTAALLIKKCSGYGFEEILEILKNTKSENAKIQCALLLFIAPKWKSLIYILILIGSDYKKLDDLCQMQIVRWIFTYNRSYAVLSEAERQTIRTLVNAKKGFLTLQIEKQLLFLVK